MRVSKDTFFRPFLFLTQKKDLKKMAEEEKDDNTGVEETTEPDSSSAEKTYEPIIDSDGFVSTTEFKEVKPEPVKAAISEETEQKTEDPPPKSKGFHDHPDFQKLIQRKNELEARIEKLEAEKATPKEPAKEQPKSKYSFKNVMSMEDGKILDILMGQDEEFTPRTFLANFAQQVAHEIRMDLEAENQQRTQVESQKTIHEKAVANMKAFFEDKPDGIAMLQDGTIDKFLEDNPGHNPISAYHQLAGENVFKAKLEEALKQEREKIHKELKAAGRASSTPSEPASKAADQDIGKPAKNKADLKRWMLKRAISK